MSTTLHAATLTLIIEFQTCDSSIPDQQWMIWKAENDRNNIRICQRLDRHSRYKGYVISTDKHKCLTTFNPVTPFMFQILMEPLRNPNYEANQYLRRHNQTNLSQQWRINSSTHQLASVQYPQLCMTHYLRGSFFVVDDCIAHGYESPNSQLIKYQHFYLEPALDQNGKEICYY